MATGVLLNPHVLGSGSVLAQRATETDTGITGALAIAVPGSQTSSTEVGNSGGYASIVQGSQGITTDTGNVGAPDIRVSGGVFAGSRNLYKSSVVADSPVVFWEVNEGSGSNINDLSSNNLDGTQTNCTWVTPGPLDQPYSLNFGGNNSDDRIQRADNALFDGSSISISGWFKTSSGAGTFLARDDAAAAFSARSFRVYLDGTNINLRRFSGSAAVIYSLPHGITITDGNWHWIGCRYTSSAFTAAIDGTDLGSTATTGSVNSTARPLTAGAITDGSGYASEFNGELALIAYWAGTTVSVATMIGHYDAAFTGAGENDIANAGTHS